MKNRVLTVVVLLLGLLPACEKDKITTDPATLTDEDFYGAWISDEDASVSGVTKLMIFYDANDWYSDIADTNACLIYFITETDTTLKFNGSFHVEDGVVYTKYVDEEHEINENYENDIIEYSGNSMSLESTSDAGKRIWKKTTTIIKQIPSAGSYEGIFFGGKNCYWENLQKYSLTGVGCIQKIVFDGATAVFIGPAAYSRNGVFTTLSVSGQNVVTQEVRGAAVINGDIYVAAMITTSNNYLYGYWKNGVWNLLTDAIVFDAGTDGTHFYCCGIYTKPSIDVACYWVDGVRTDLVPPVSGQDAIAYSISFINGDMYISGHCEGNPANSYKYQSHCVWINGEGKFIGTGYGNLIKTEYLNNKVTYLTQGYYYSYMMGLYDGTSGITFSEMNYGGLYHPSVVFNDGYYYVAASPGSSFKSAYFFRVKADLKEYSTIPVVDGIIYSIAKKQ